MHVSPARRTRRMVPFGISLFVACFAPRSALAAPPADAAGPATVRLYGRAGA